MRTPIDERQTGAQREEQNIGAKVNATVPASIEALPRTFAVEACVRFLRNSWLAAIIISAVVLIPCFWHKRIEAGDLASHTYNAWLALLIERGQAPGLVLANQWNNVLIDASLSRLGSLVGLPLAEKICVSAAVLVFFWGAFALIGAIARRAPWSVVPAIAMFAYGWTFQAGFLNYYVSVGLAFFGIAVAHRGKGLEKLLALLVLPLAWVAHPLGAALLAGMGFYVVIASKLSVMRQMALLVGSSCLMLVATAYVASHYSLTWSDDGALQRLITFNGADQLVLYSARYWVPSVLVIVYVMARIILDAHTRRARGEPWTIYSLPLQLYGLSLLAGILLPSSVTLPGFAAPLNLLAPRLTSVTAVLACCLLGVTRPQKWHFPALAAIAAIFMLLLYADTAKLNKMEEQTERYERVLPPGSRVIATLWPFVGSRLLINHIVDRACIGHCFSYGNYEPSSGQFRVRVRSENPIVLATAESSDEVSVGKYIVRAQDLPIFEIYQCNLNMTELCMSELSVGERNGSLGVQPDTQAKHVAADRAPVR
jgi:hypothetical protein